MKHFLYVIFILLIFSCKNDFSPVERKTLMLAGENQQQLKRMLEHYQHSESDKQKLKAARFLIGNMPGHFSYDSTYAVCYRPVIDAINKMTNSGLPMKAIGKKANLLLDSLIAIYPLSLIYSKGVDDLHQIQSDMLINNIDLAFEYYNKNPFKDSILFNDFLEYVLPYRLQNGYCLENWRSYFTHNYSLNENARDVHQLCDSLLYNFRHIRNGWGVADQYPYIKLNDYLKSQITRCSQRCWFNGLLLRSFGIPVAIDFVPSCRVHQSGHEWNTLKLKDGIYPFEPFWQDSLRYLKAVYSGKKEHPTIGPIRFSKVYRKTFKMNISELLEHALKTEEDIPPFFRNPFIRDVSNEYFQTYGLEVPIIKDVADLDYAYACVLGVNQTWLPVDFGKIRRNKIGFRSLGAGIAYLPCRYESGTLTPVAYPILLNDDGSPSVLCPDTTHLRELRIAQVAYPRPGLNYDKKAFNGVTIEASNDRNFKKSEILWQINRAYEPGTWYIPFHTNSRYRYVRLVLPCKKIRLNEIKFFEKSKESVKYIKGELISSSPRDSLIFKRANDSKLTTSFVATEIGSYNIPRDRIWFGYDFGQPVLFGGFEFYFAFDVSVRKKGVYELMYWDFEWKTVGIKRAASMEVSFDHVPQNALLMIKIRDTGKFSRIFTYSEGKQHWW